MARELQELRGISFERLEDPIGRSLFEYEAQSGGCLEFDLTAIRLHKTAAKSTDAQSVTKVKYKGEFIGLLRTVLFDVHQATGSEKNYKLDKLRVAKGYPRRPDIVPTCSANHSEVLLPMLTVPAHTISKTITMYQGAFDVLGLAGRGVKKIAAIGQAPTDQPYTMPAYTLISWHGPNGLEQRGNPGTVFSVPADRLQVAGFLAISHEVAARHPEALACLNPTNPFGGNCLPKPGEIA